MSKPDVLAVAKLHPFYQKALESLYTVHDRTHVTDPAAFAALAPRIVGVAGTGEASVPRSLLSQLPNAKVVAVFGVGTIVLGLTRSFWVAFFAVMVLHGADMVSVFIRGSIVPLVTPDDKRGRVSAVENVFIGATNELGAFESGVAAQAVGVPATVVGGGILTLGIVGVWWFKFKSMRDVDRFEDLKPA